MKGLGPTCRSRATVQRCADPCSSCQGASRASSRARLPRAPTRWSSTSRTRSTSLRRSRHELSLRNDWRRARATRSAWSVSTAAEPLTSSATFSKSSGRVLAPSCCRRAARRLFHTRACTWRLWSSDSPSKPAASGYWRWWRMRRESQVSRGCSTRRPGWMPCVSATRTSRSTWGWPTATSPRASSTTRVARLRSPLRQQASPPSTECVWPSETMTPSNARRAPL